MLEKSSGLMRMLVVAFLFTGLVMSCDKDDDPKPSLSAPAVNAATDITANSFKISWAQVTGADKYLVDVSTNANFSSTLNNYSKKEVTTTNLVVTGLNAKTKYYFRVYAKKGTTTSAASGVKDATTAE
ncbi:MULTISPECIES: fibronectin type III domain-containing protein [Roseivirga]|jgi:hypothetical protein|nr:MULTISPECIES: fibronectin type III domain-containing protein [Roseivirga]MEC7755913.1 fibronectin type III domain-containing protein [Bacteroidota bacterium]|tara:strand:+ start:1289 stop:1672 length:384 start_codon:yes stop_codon:yes gene_type:complete